MRLRTLSTKHGGWGSQKRTLGETVSLPPDFIPQVRVPRNASRDEATRPVRRDLVLNDRSWLEVEAQLRCVRPRGNKVRAAERRQEVVERGLVRQVDGGEAQAPLVMVAMEQVVVPHAGIEQVAWFDARRIVIDVECRAGDINQLRARLRGIRAADSACAYSKSLRQ